MTTHNFKKGDIAYIWDEFHRDNHVVGRIVQVVVDRALKDNKCRVIWPCAAPYVSSADVIRIINEDELYPSLEAIESVLLDRYSRYIKKDLEQMRRDSEQNSKEVGNMIRHLFAPPIQPDPTDNRVMAIYREQEARSM